MCCGGGLKHGSFDSRKHPAAYATSLHCGFADVTAQQLETILMWCKRAKKK